MYAPYSTSRTRNPDVAEGLRLARTIAEDIDRNVAAESTCGRCGHRGLRYRGHYEDGQYVAETVCPCCRAAEAF